MESTDRSFTVIDIRRPGKGGKKMPIPSDGGRFVSKTPRGAAGKAFTEACDGKKGSCKLVVTIQETTSGGDGKVFSYKMKREKYDQPREIRPGSLLGLGGKTITFNYKISGVATDVPKDI